eukprot:TRINITY_DN3101_c0_g1_i2.p1 TRINITY_DN3101_c0_g1~~TRINITY_DN3101_c0_g1_i2.p1  ORF type:complete len:282 (-),score=12.64 TRINITY_DN3101_c0_g1_i2:161-1006(-)
MRRLQRVIYNRVDKISGGSFAGAICFFVFGYVILLIMAVQGPNTFVEEPDSTGVCQKAFWRKRDDVPAINETIFQDALYCSFCREFRDAGPSLYGIKLALYPANASVIPPPKISIILSEMGTEFSDIKCSDMDRLVSTKDFPWLREQKINPIDKEWAILGNNLTTESTLLCHIDEFHTYKCETRTFFRQKVRGFARINTFVKVPDIVGFDHVNFLIVYNNANFARFNNIFNFFFIVVAVLCFILYYQKIRVVPTSDWHYLHRWSLILLFVKFEELNMSYLD